MRSIIASVKLTTPPPLLWKAITDHEALPQHTSFLRQVRVIERELGGVGTVRECTLFNGTSFTERITQWEEGWRYCYEPNLQQAPFPFRWAESCWSIRPTDGGSQLTYQLRYEPRSKLKDVVNYAYLRIRAVSQIKKMLRSFDVPSMSV